jgi:hypothetical protein
VLQLLDRHKRDCAALAARLGVPHHDVPEDVPGSPFEVIRVLRRPGWKESALWWPEQRALVVAEALGTTEHFTLGHGPVGVHPLLRLTPPWALRGYVPDHLLVGHGKGRARLAHGGRGGARARDGARRRAQGVRPPGRAAGLSGDAPRHALARAVEAAHHGAGGDVERPGGLGVAEAGQVDRDQHVAEVGGQLGDGAQHLVGLGDLVGAGHARAGVGLHELLVELGVASLRGRA